MAFGLDPVLDPTACYRLTNTVNGTVYFGISREPNTRLKFHFGHYNESMPISKAIRKYGREVFAFEIMQIVPTRQVAWDWERTVIAAARAAGTNTYNVTAGGEGAAGWKRQHSPETKEKIRQSLRGKKQSPESIAKRVAKLRGRKKSRESVERTAAANRGRKATDEHRAKLRASHLGLPGNRKGQPVSAETRAKIAASLRGRPQSTVQRERHRVTMTAWWARRKEENASGP